MFEITYLARALGLLDDPSAKIKKVGHSLKCTTTGFAMMARKDSDFIDIWNDGFSKFDSKGGLKRLCNESTKKHDKGTVIFQKGHRIAQL